MYLQEHEPNHRIPYARSVASDCGGREVTDVPCQSQASYLPHLHAHTHTLASLQKIEIGLRLFPFRSGATAPDPCGMWSPYYQGDDSYGFGYGIRLPARPCGFSPWHGPLPPPGWARSLTSNQPRRSATAPQQHAARPSCSGSGRSVSVLRKGGRELTGVPCQSGLSKREK